jgi:hypothetical protein
VILNCLSEAESLELIAEPSVVCLHFLPSKPLLLFVNYDTLCLLHYIII